MAVVKNNLADKKYPVTSKNKKLIDLKKKIDQAGQKNKKHEQNFQKSRKSRN